MELIPIIDPKSSPISVMGFAERKWAERNNLTHLTTLIIPVTSDGRIQMQIRPPHKSYPGCRDFFGGHVSLTGDIFGCLLGVPFDLARIVAAAAEREANEELRPHTTADRLPIDIDSNALVRVGGLGDFPCDIEGNRERSTLFLFPIHQDCVLAPMDDIEGRFVSVETEFYTFDEVVARYQTHPQNPSVARTSDYDTNKRGWQFADGAGRILADASLAATARGAIAALTADSFRPVAR